MKKKWLPVLMIFLMILNSAACAGGTHPGTAGTSSAPDDTDAGADAAGASDDSGYEQENYDIYPASAPDSEQLLELSLVHWIDDTAEESVQTFRAGMTLEEFMQEAGVSYEEMNFLCGEDGEAYDPRTDLLEPGAVKKIILSLSPDEDPAGPAEESESEESGSEESVLYIENLTDTPEDFSDATVVSLDLMIPETYWIRYMDSEPFTIADMVTVLGRDFICSARDDIDLPFYTWTNTYGSARFEIGDSVAEAVLTLADADLAAEEDNYELPDLPTKDDVFNYLLKGFIWGESEEETEEQIRYLQANGVDIFGTPAEDISCAYNNGELYMISYAVSGSRAVEASLVYTFVRYLGDPALHSAGLYETIDDTIGNFIWEDGDLTVIVGRGEISFYRNFPEDQ